MEFVIKIGFQLYSRRRFNLAARFGLKLKLLIVCSCVFTLLCAFFDGISKHPYTRGARTDAPLSGARPAGEAPISAWKAR